MHRLLVLAVLVLAAGLAAGCGSDDDDDDGDAAAPTTTTTTATDDCAAENLETQTPGKLTIATDDPQFPPWFEGAKKDEPWSPTTPPTKKGYEAQVVYGIAEELGYTDADVEWTVAAFNRLFRPGPKDFDFAVAQVSYTDERAEVVDFSESYYEVEQAIVTVEGSRIAEAGSLADLKDAKLGAQIGTTGYDTIVDVVDPNREPSVYDTTNDAISGLKADQIDGIVVDYPTALYMSAVQVENGTIPGRLPRREGDPEHFGLVFEKGSPLVECVNDAIGTLRENGTLERLEQQWIVGGAPPVLR